MTFSDRMRRWNAWYDGLPEDWRFQLLVWPVLIIAAINMALTIAVGFPFGLLAVLAILAVAALRLPYVMGWISPGAPVAKSNIAIPAPDWLINANLWYDGLPESRRPFVLLAIFVVAGGLNMVLTIDFGFSFGLLFLLALLAVILIRGPYVAGWLLPPAAAPTPIAAAAPPQPDPLPAPTVPIAAVVPPQPEPPPEPIAPAD